MMLDHPTVSQNNGEDAVEYVRKILTYDVKKIIAIGHGYASLVQLDMEEGVLTADTVDEYISDLRGLFQSMEMCLEKATEVYLSKFED